jgi:hypothetical protein
MSKAISDELESWEKVQDELPVGDCGLLIGNGASIALWSKFGYRSLFEIARETRHPEHLIQQEADLLSQFDTNNFEAVLSAQITAGKVWNVFKKPDHELENLRES